MTQRGPRARHVPAVLVGKAARALTRLRGGGSAFPGYLANRIAPGLLASLAGQFRDGVVFVLGSNGKTTTTHMLSEILRAHDVRVFTNPTGANLPQGVTSALLADATVSGRVRADAAVLEVDEGYASDLADVLAPRVLVALNVQVDQLYRFYETERVADMMIEAASRASGQVVLAADDPYLSKADASRFGAPVAFFGVAPEVLAASAHGLANAPDTRSPDPGARPHRPQAEVIRSNGRDVVIRVDEQEIEVRLPAAGLHYAVDAAAALCAAAHLLGDRFDPGRAARGFRSMAPAYGRGERVPLRKDRRGEQVEFVMFKNGPSLQLNLDAIQDPPPRVLLAIDEGTPDISWFYDVDLSALDHVDVVTGEKAHQIATRLAYAGVPVGAVEPDLERAVTMMRALEASPTGSQTWLVNYEIMMAGRRLLGFGDQEVARR